MLQFLPLLDLVFGFENLNTFTKSSSCVKLFTAEYFDIIIIQIMTCFKDMHRSTTIISSILLGSAVTLLNLLTTHLVFRNPLGHRTSSLTNVDTVTCCALDFIHNTLCVHY